MRALVATAVIALAALALTPRDAQAQAVTVGVYAPSTPFDGTAARLDFANKLAAHLGGAGSVGRVYGKGSDFAAALAKGEIQLAVVDAEFLATTSAAHTALAVAVRDGDTAAAWQLVARAPATSILDLRGKTVLAPVTDGRHVAFVDNALLGGELAAGFWKVEASPDALSAVAAVGLGKADAAVVPTGVALPGGVARIATLPTVSWPVLIAAKDAPAAVVAAARERAATFGGAGAISGFRTSGVDGYRGLARRMKRVVRQVPLLVPNLRIAVGDLIEGRTFTIARPAASSYFRAR
ncbi:MAG: hypothetical protein IPL61_31240 [Myxococcales bacterium]|nr:hypothetical protein [Myxococcales bacterium]